MMGLSPWMGIRETAEYLDMTYRHVQRLRAAGKFPAPDGLIGASPRWHVDTLDAFLREQAKVVYANA